MKLRLAALLSWACFPIYIWQGLGVRSNSVRHAPPFPQQVKAIRGKGKPIRLLLVGDSSAAGVGVKQIEKSLGGHLIKYCAEKSVRPVTIRIAGCNSATASQIRDYVVPNIEFEPFTHVILNIGTNDAKNFHTRRRFRREFGTLLYALNSRFPDARIIWSGIFDMSQVPALPSLLANILGIRSRLLMQCGRILCDERLVEIPDGKWDASKENFSSDGFHASKKGYREWAELLAEHILSK